MSYSSIKADLDKLRQEQEYNLSLIKQHLTFIDTESDDEILVPMYYGFIDDLKVKNEEIEDQIRCLEEQLLCMKPKPKPEPASMTQLLSGSRFFNNRPTTSMNDSANKTDTPSLR
jgi:hypothetical protein